MILRDFLMFLIFCIYLNVNNAVLKLLNNYESGKIYFVKGRAPPLK